MEKERIPHAAPAAHRTPASTPPQTATEACSSDTSASPALTPPNAVVTDPRATESAAPKRSTRTSFPAQRAPDPGTSSEAARTYARCITMPCTRRFLSSPARIPPPILTRHGGQMSEASRLRTTRERLPQARQVPCTQSFLERNFQTVEKSQTSTRNRRAARGDS